MSKKKAEFDYEQLDPGIREVVRWLHSQKFRTTDSGDGVSKFPEGYKKSELFKSRYAEDHGLIEIPHVFIRTQKSWLTRETDRLRAVLYTDHGIELSGGEHGPNVAASYDAHDEIPIIGLFNVNDAMLRPKTNPNEKDENEDHQADHQSAEGDEDVA